MQHIKGKQYVPNQSQLNQGVSSVQNNGQNNHVGSLFQPNQNPTYLQPRNMMPKVEMHRKDPPNWINQMENFFELHQTPSKQKVTLESLYLEPNQFVWYRWLCAQRQKSGLSVTWTVFTEELQLHYGSIVSDNYFSQLEKLRQTRSTKDYVHQF